MAVAKVTTDSAKQEIQALIDQIAKLEASIEKIAPKNAAGMRTMSMSNKAAREAYERLNRTLEAVTAKLAVKERQLKRLEAAQTRAGVSSKNLGTTFEETGEKGKKSGEKIEKSSNRASGSQGGLLKSVKALLAAFGIIAGLQLFANIAKNVFNLTLKFDSLRFAMQRITADAWEYEQSQQFLLELNKDFGAELIVTAERWIRFRAAAMQSNMTLLDTEKIFRSVTKASAVMGLATDELKSVYLALEQMLSKGKVTTEELRRQLGERLPGAMGIMAASMGITIPKLDELLKKGKVLSAEVLPGFADALEVAYGIEAVEKVETLRAAVGRLSGAWQIFVANLGESEGLLMRLLSGATDKLVEFMEFIQLITADDNQRKRIDILPFRDDIDKRIKAQATKALEELEGVYDVEKKLREKMAKNRLDYSKTINKEERLQLNKDMDVLVKDLVEYNNKIDDQKKGIAANDYFKIEKEFITKKEVYEKTARELEQKEQALFDETNGARKQGLKEEIEILKSRKYLQYGDMLLLEAEYDLKKKLLEVAGEPYAPDDDSKKMRRREVDDIRDLEKEIQIAILQKIMEGHEAALNAEETGHEKRINIFKKNNDLRNRMAELQLAIEIDKIDAAEKKKLEALNKPLAENEIGLDPKVKADQEAKIHLETLQKKEIATEEYQKKAIASSNELNRQLMGIDKVYADEALKIVEDKYNKMIIAAKEEYENSNKTAKDKKKLDLELKRIAIEAGNAVIDKQIELLKWKLLNLDLDKEVIDNYLRMIAELEAKRNVNEPPDAKDWQDYFEEILGYLLDYNNAIGSLVDNLYARKIENINAEIAAEKDKYDALILLAKDDATQKETLERNKDLRIKELERKRLKEEQKQARARKAFAISDILINTAVAISKTLRDGGAIFGIPLVPIVAALGALQVAAVLAQPIPQYKDGGKIQKSEVAMINDGIWQEYVERDGEILTTKRKNAIVNLKQGDVVHRNFNEMKNNAKSDVILDLAGGSSISESEFNRLFLGIESSVKSGLKHAKINNHVHVIAPRDNGGYREQMARW